MTHTELVQVAKRRGFVKWYPSGVVEQVTRSPQKVVFAQGVEPYGRTHAIIERDEHRCREVTRRDAMRFRIWLTHARTVAPDQVSQ